MANESCITQDLKTLLLNMIEKKRPYEMMAVIVADAMPVCEASMFQELAESAKAASERAAPEQWPAAVLYKEDGSKEEGTISGLYKDTFNERVTEAVVCRVSRPGLPDCRAVSAVENWRAKGYLVKGNGEPAPVITKDMSTNAATRMFKDWKEKLIKEGKAINIYHPSQVETKKKSK